MFPGACSQSAEGTNWALGVHCPDTMENRLVSTGTVKWFSEEKGFGFIVPDEGGKDLFVHRSNVETDDRVLRDGQKVEFEVGQGRKGPEATKVRPA